ncbi:MAG: hypothetical protein ABIT09_08620 [Croceibacterium sp.]
MIVELEKLCVEELMLLDAAYGMPEYFVHSRLDDVVEEISFEYGFDGFPTHEQNLQYFATLEKLADNYRRAVGYRRNTSMIGDRLRLNKRSHNLLILLAGQCSEKLANSGGWLGDHGMSAPEHAFFQLASYGLLRPAPGGGFWTSEGEKAANFALSDQFAPLKDFTFADLL